MPFAAARAAPYAVQHPREPLVASTSQIVYQPYLPGARGALKAGTAIPCRTAEEGVRRAERAIAGGSVLGAEIVRVTHDEAADEFGEPEFLARFGRTPQAD